MAERSLLALADSEQTKRGEPKGTRPMRITMHRTQAALGFLLIATAAMLMVVGVQPGCGQANDGPTRETAVQTERELARAMRTNDGDGFCRLLDPDWAVVNGIGGLEDNPGKGKSICAAMKAGTFIRKSYEPDLANARVRVYGDIATVTFKLSLSGALEDKEFSGKEVQTDVLRWEGGGWKCVLTHETNVAGTLVIK
jgi:ketosteroid isomerase-like protein